MLRGLIYHTKIIFLKQYQGAQTKIFIKRKNPTFYPI